MSSTRDIRFEVWMFSSRSCMIMDKAWRWMGSWRRSSSQTFSQKLSIHSCSLTVVTALEVYSTASPPWQHLTYCAPNPTWSARRLQTARSRSSCPPYRLQRKSGESQIDPYRTHAKNNHQPWSPLESSHNTNKTSKWKWGGEVCVSAGYWCVYWGTLFSVKRAVNPVSSPVDWKVQIDSL